MTSATTQRFPALDGIRALAAFAVVCTHVGFVSGRSLRSDVFGPILSRGDFGVTVFFLLSGFLLYRPFALHSMGVSRKPLLGQYLLRRLLRIYPALMLFVVITLTWITPYRVRTSDYVHYLLLIQTYNHHDYDPNLSQLWTLAIEVAFYLMLPLLAWLATRSRAGKPAALQGQIVMLGVLAAVAPIFTVLQLHVLRGTQALLWIPAYLDWFAIGMGLALLTAIPASSAALGRLRGTLRELAAAPGTCWLVSAVLYLLACTPIGVPRTLAPALYWQWTVQHYLYAGAALFLLLPVVLGSGGVVGRALGSPVGHYLGNISYSVYLWHVPLMPVIQRNLGFEEFRGHFPEILIVTLLCSVAAATASWYLIEQPILRYGSRPWRGARAAPPIAQHTIPATQSS